MSEAQLSDSQAIILSTACARSDGAVFPVTANLKGGAVGNVCKSLLKRGLIEEIPAGDLNTVWRHDEEQGPMTLRATPLAVTTLGITDEQDSTPMTEVSAEPQPESAPEPAPTPAFRAGTKQARMIAMLEAPAGPPSPRSRRRWTGAAHRPRRDRRRSEEAARARRDSEKIDGRGRVYRLGPVGPHDGQARAA